MARAAASTSMFRKGVEDSDKNLIAFDRTVKSTRPSIDQLSGRLAILARVGATLGPAFAPLTTAIVPALAGLSTQLGFAAAAGGTAILAFQGVGDALKAVNTASLEPTTANIEKAQIALEGLSPAAQNLVGQLQEMRGSFAGLRDAAAEGFLPGVSESLDSLETQFPRFESILTEIGDAAGDALSAGADSLASDRWSGFFDFLESQARPVLTEMGQTVGDLTHGLAELWMALTPLSTDFTGGLAKAADGFDKWATGLTQTEGFGEFLAYVQETGPQVVEMLGSLANAVLQIGEAAAPLGGPVLQIISALADGLAAIADSDIGTPIMAVVTAMSALSLAQLGIQKVGDTMFGGFILGQTKASAGVRTLTADLRTLRAVEAQARLGALTPAQKATQAGAYGNVKKTAVGVGKSAALVGGVALAASGVADDMALANTASLALMGTIAGPWGAAIGGGIGLVMDFANAHDDASSAIEKASAALASGDADSMTAALEQLKRQRDDLTTSDTSSLGNLIGDLAGDASGLRNLGEIESKMRAIGDALAGLNYSGTGAVAGLLTLPLGITSRDAALAAASVEDLRREFELLNNALTGRASWRDYEAAIDGVTEAIKKNGKTLDITNQKGRDNQAALDSIASTSIKVAENLSGMDRVRFLRRARKDFIDAAVDLGKPRKAAQDLADRLGLLDRTKARPKVDAETKDAYSKLTDVQRKILGLPNKQVKVTADTSGAYGQIDSLRAALNSIPDENVYIRMIQTGLVGQRAKANDARSADGSTVPKTGLPYADRHPYLLADGEEVISNRYGQADKHRALLKAINANRLADGGTAQREYLASRNSSSTTRVLVGGTATARIDIPGLGQQDIEIRLRQIARDELADSDDMRGMTERTVYGDA